MVGRASSEIEEYDCKFHQAKQTKGDRNPPSQRHQLQEYISCWRPEPRSQHPTAQQSRSSGCSKLQTQDYFRVKQGIPPDRGTRDSTFAWPKQAINPFCMISNYGPNTEEPFWFIIILVEWFLWNFLNIFMLYEFKKKNFLGLKINFDKVKKKS